MLLVGRALLGLGVASAMTAGLKALVLWFPGDRVPLLNGLMVMLGALGAVTATLPADLLLDWIGWRELFGLLAALTAASAVLIYLIVPETAPVATGPVLPGLRKVYADPSFWRLAPLSASCIGTAWAFAGTLGGAMAPQRGGPRSYKSGISFVCHGGGPEFGRHPARGRCRSAAEAWCRTRGAPGACCGLVYCDSARTDPALAFTVIFTVGGCCGGRRGYRAQLCNSSRIFSETARRTGQRS